MSLLEELNNAYPGAACELVYGTDFELLISVILSAQCTDKRVNLVTRELFRVADTPEEFCELETEKLESLIKSCGLYKNKAANIKAACKAITERFGGRVPQTREELMSLPGVGRKTANVMLSVAFGEPAIAVDTHVFRVSHRLGLSDGKTPDLVEKDLCAAFEPSAYKNVHFLLIHHGRNCCKAQSPDCGNCPVTAYCREYNIRSKNQTV